MNGERMTKWEWVYRALGGVGPEDYHNDHGYFQRTHKTHKTHLATYLARVLSACGFLARDPRLSEFDRGWYAKFRWQWKFWRGPYRDVIEQAKRDGKAWAQNL